MVDDPKEILLDHLRSLRDTCARIEMDVRDTKARVTSMERYLAATHGDLIEHRGEIDGLKDRLARVEKRLEIHD